MSSGAAINNLGGCALNPRGNLWFKDESTLGHKLLMKMGWSKGKGLGKNEDGIKENVKVRYRDTNTGLGFKDDAHNNIMKTEYESILKGLHDEYSNKKAPSDNKSIDKSQKSRIVKSRLRYPKLFFGKDVTKYSEKDMKSIFICSQPVADIENKVEDSAISIKEEPEGNSSKSLDTYSSELSISDYFAKKMEEKKNNILIKNSNHNSKQTFMESENHQENLSTNTGTSERKTKISEINVCEDSLNSLNLQSVPFDYDGNSENLASSKCKKASKKRKKNSELDINEVETDELHTCENEQGHFRKKKQKLSEDSGFENMFLDNEALNIEKTLNKSCKSDGKKQNSQACENDFNSKDVTEMFPGDIACYVAESSLVVGKKKKKNKIKNKKLTSVELPLENCVSEKNENLTESYRVTNNDTVLESTNDKSANDENCSRKKKKLKKKLKQKLKSCLKKKRDSYSLKHVSFNESVSYRIIDSEFESVDCLVDDHNLDVTESSSEVDDHSLVVTESSSEIDDPSASNNAFSVEDVKSDEQTENTGVQEDISEESDEDYSLSSLPSTESSYYNCWVESQRQALKMKIYKSMLRSIKKHDILRTSNLLSIKGYGNWGF